MSGSDHIHAEILYGTDKGLVHSDVCTADISDEYRELLHQCLDEFLNNYDPSGGFAVGNFTLGD